MILQKSNPKVKIHKGIVPIICSEEGCEDSPVGIIEPFSTSIGAVWLTYCQEHLSILITAEPNATYIIWDS